jgi:tripeptide aminopeptidase
VLTPSEEVGLLGAFAFDQERLLARAGYVYDVDAAIGEVILGAPSAVQLEARFRGRAAHAGIAPEEGRSAIRAAALALAEMPLGRIDEETTANVGVIAGGSALNVVPEHCSLGGEARSHDERKLADQIQAMQDALSFAAGVSDCAVETTLRRSYSSYRFARDDLPVRLAAEALSRCGVEPSYSLTGGAADANVFNAGGRQCVNLGNGVLAIHTRDEHVAVGDLDLMVEVTLALIDAARG